MTTRERVWAGPFLLAACVGVAILLSGCFMQEACAMEINLKGTKAVFIIAKNNFQDEELAVPEQYLSERACNVKIASTGLGEARGMLGATVQPDMLYTDIKPADFDLIVFVGGSGASCYFDDSKSHQIARAAVADGKLLGAICIAPSTLARAGVLKGVKATCFPSQRRDLRNHGAVVEDAPVVRDGNIITAVGPEAAGQFAKTLAFALAQHLKEKTK